MADREAARWIGGPLSRAMAWRGFLTIAGAWAVQGFGMFSVLERDTGAWVGRLGPWMPEGWPGPEVGWGIVRSRWGRGYATEGVGRRHGLGLRRARLGARSSTASTRPTPPRSGSPSGSGSRRRGPGRLPEPFDATPVEIWGQTREEWRSRRAAA